ncbi:ABC transporter ATP-binding protein [Brevundimonas sp. AJA228-03]|uniref:ABC transporter ATP-binding protein n=1 Tax=Brevundimonas sp. AJA228-03 TaxID=2752515 RepID=UPI001ADF27A4|nr:ABC transporter ATP-binding protein [Brevundimonas sp. AJA228-03]QTN20388.1 ABC transporter ATP-binding protein [Brevundimonas sp. AJA228-03]
MIPVLEAQGIEKVFLNGDEETRVLKGIDLTLDKGELAALLGASGSGKSTLLSIVGLLLRPTAGRLTISGEPVYEYTEQKRAQFRNRRLGFVFQFHHLLPDFTAMENVAFPAAAPAGGISHDMRDRARDLLTRVGLEDRIDFPATRLSGGQKQRVAIARALMNRPDLIIADEPTGNLDRTSADQVLDLMREVNRQDGATFLICTHDEGVAAKCSRRLTLEDGLLASNVAISPDR